MPFRIHADPQNIFFRCVEDSNEAIMISNSEGLLIYVNPAWTRIYGYTQEEALGKSPRLLHSGIHSPEFYKEMWEKILNPQIGHWKGDLVNKAKSGKLVPVFLTITPMRSQKGEVSGFMGIAVDMTFKKELETKVAHQDRLASIGMLASGVAHEIGTPLGVVRGRAEYLMMKSEDPTFKKNFDIMISQIDRISKLIKSLLRVSRRLSDIHLEDVNVLDVANEILALVGQNLRGDSVEIRLEIEPNFKIRADFDRLEQVLLNLIVNATYAIRKAKSDGRTEDHFLRLAAEIGKDGKARVIVQDSGCGIAPEHMKKLFQPFFTTKDVGEGTGLGHAIVSQIMSELDGEISVQSKLGEGTVFVLTFHRG